MNAIPREEFTFKFDGLAVERHEIEVSLLAESLIALRSLAERSCKMLYGNSDDLVVKVKGGFKPGSFSVALILDWINQNQTAATIATTSIGATIAGFLGFYKWSKGKKVECEPRGEKTIQVTNYVGHNNNFNADVVNLYLNSGARNDAEKLTRPLEQAGVDMLSFSAGDADGTVIQIEKGEREFFGKKEHGVLREDEFTVTLEIVIANLRGDSAGWRFFDGSTDFSATIEDESFLDKVKSGKIVFHTGDMLEVKMHIVQRRPAHRLVTERSVIEVLTYLPAQKED